MIEFMVIATSEVPTANLSLIPRTRTSAGTIKNPPPIPSRPVRTPTAEAVRTTKGQDALEISFSETWCRHMPKAAANIKNANINISALSEKNSTSRDPSNVPKIPNKLKVIPTRISKFLDFNLRKVPENAAAPTITMEDVVAAVVERPITAINPGTARIAPPAPTMPRTEPINVPRINPSKIST